MKPEITRFRLIRGEVAEQLHHLDAEQTLRVLESVMSQVIALVISESPYMGKPQGEI